MGKNLHISKLDFPSVKIACHQHKNENLDLHVNALSYPNTIIIWQKLSPIKIIIENNESKRHL